MLNRKIQSEGGGRQVIFSSCRDKPTYSHGIIDDCGEYDSNKFLDLSWVRVRVDR